MRRPSPTCRLAIFLLASLAPLALAACKGQTKEEVARVRTRRALLAGTTKKVWRMTSKSDADRKVRRPPSVIQKQIRHAFSADGTYEIRVGGYTEGGEWKLDPKGGRIHLRTKAGNESDWEILELGARKLVVKDRTTLLGVTHVGVLTYEWAGAARKQPEKKVQRP